MKTVYRDMLARLNSVDARVVSLDPMQYKLNRSAFQV